MDAMVDEYLNGNEIVYGVRSNRDSDTWFKRTTAQEFYKFLRLMGVGHGQEAMPLSQLFEVLFDSSVVVKYPIF